ADPVQRLEAQSRVRCRHLHLHATGRRGRGGRGLTGPAPPLLDSGIHMHGQPQPMIRRRRDARLLLIAACLATLPALAQSAPIATPPAQVVVPAPQRLATSGDEALDNAVAAVVVAALSEQMNTPSIAVAIESFDVAIAGL